MKLIMTLALILKLLIVSGCGKKEVRPPTTDLHSAVVTDNLEAIRQHIKAGSDLNVLEPSRASTPLLTAAALGKIDAALILIDAGAALNYQNNDGSTALHTAAFFCRTEIVKALLEKGIDKSIKNKMGKTALEIVEIPFEYVKPAYDAFGESLKPTGLVLDYDRIEKTRPIIAEMLR